MFEEASNYSKQRKEKLLVSGLKIEGEMKPAKIFQVGLKNHDKNKLDQ